jgi:surface protein
MPQYCNRPIAGKKLTHTEPPTTENVVVPYDNSTRGVAMNSNMASSDPETQYQRLKLMQNTVRVSSSLYSMNAGALNVGTQSEAGITTVNWSQMSDRPDPHIQTARYSMKSSVSIRPGNMSPGGIGCDVKHNSYDRYLARIKAAGPLRKDNMTIDFGNTDVPFDPANPVYGGKTLKTSIGDSKCGCGPIISPDVLTLSYSYYVVGNFLINQPAAYFERFVPLQSSDGALIYVVTVTKETTKISIDIKYSFVDDGQTTDGFTFNVPGLVDFYNSTSGLTIGAFGSIPLSRAGHQFEGLNVLPLFLDSTPPGLLRGVVPNVPIILENTSLAYCFANVIDFNGQDDIILNMDVSKSINTSYMFYKSGYNPVSFVLDITNIYNMESMFEETYYFNPAEMELYSVPIYTFPSSVQLAAAGQSLKRVQRLANMRKTIGLASVSIAKATKPVKKPVVVKKMTNLLKKAKAFVGIKFTYFNPNAQIQATTRLSRATEEPISVGEDMTGMFYDCESFNPTTDFEMYAVPTKLDYTYFNAQHFNGNLQNTVAEWVETMDYAFAGATEFGSNDNTGLTEWDLASVTSTVNVFSNTSIEPSLVPNYFAFWYSFVYTGPTPLSDQDVIDKIPLEQTGFFTTNTPTILSELFPGGTEYLVQFNFKYDDDGITNDGLTFNVTGKDLVSFYNTYTTGINIVKFGWIPLSRRGFQFAGLTVPILFTDTTDTTSVPTILPNTFLQSCFEGATQFNENISKWDTKNAINMVEMFKNASTFNQNISNWNVLGVLLYDNFSEGATYFESQNMPRFITRPGFVYSFIYADVETVNYADYLPIINENNSFTNISATITTNLSKTVTVYITFNFTDNGSATDGLSFNHLQDFYGPKCTSVNILKFGGIPLSRAGFQFYNIGSIVVTATDSPLILPNTSLTGFIANTTFNSPINHWENISNVTDMSFMFWYAYAFNQDIQNLDISNITNMEGMFDGAISFNGDITTWDTTNVTNMSRMFYGASSFTRNLSTWNVTNVTNYVDFATGSGITNPPLFV